MTSPSPSRREAFVVAAMTLVGAILRFWGPGHLGLNHFDEGIYALAGTWSVSPKGLWGISPQVVAYAPPLYPILVGIAYLFLGVTDVSAILVSQVAGILTIPAVAWVARRTFGPGTGAAASALCAISGPHIAFSRMALTDSSFLLCWVLAIGLGGWFLERPGVWRAIVLGLMVGLAQNAKYNGYLTGGIVATTLAWGLLVPPESGRRSILRAIGFGLIAAIIALLVYWPWYRFVQSQPDGYAGLLRHHRSYLTGTNPRAWLEHWRLQIGEAFALSGEITQGLTWGVVAWPIAWIGGSWVEASRPAESASREVKRYRRGMRLRLGFVAGAALYGVAPSAGYWVALALAPFELMSRSPARRILAVGWCVMAVLTPFYHPYARLALPLHAFGWIALASLVPDPDRGSVQFSLSPRIARIRGVALALALGVALVSDAVIEPRARAIGSPIGPSDGLKLACDRAVASLTSAPPGFVPVRLQVVARPAVLFYLASRLKIPVIRQPDLAAAVRAFRGGDYYLADTGLGSEAAQIDARLLDHGFQTQQMLNRMQFLEMESPGTTYLDVEPGEAFLRGGVPWRGAALTLQPVIPR